MAEDDISGLIITAIKKIHAETKTVQCKSVPKNFKDLVFEQLRQIKESHKREIESSENRNDELGRVLDMLKTQQTKESSTPITELSGLHQSLKNQQVIMEKLLSRVELQGTMIEKLQQQNKLLAEEITKTRSEATKSKEAARELKSVVREEIGQIMQGLEYWKAIFPAQEFYAQTQILEDLHRTIDEVKTGSVPQEELDQVWLK